MFFVFYPCFGLYVLFSNKNNNSKLSTFFKNLMNIKLKEKTTHRKKTLTQRQALKDLQENNNYKKKKTRET